MVIRTCRFVSLRYLKLFFFQTTMQPIAGACFCALQAGGRGAMVSVS